MRFADLDAVTVDGMGTLLELDSPIEPLRAALVARGVERSVADVSDAFAAEVAHYRPRSHLARDAGGLRSLRQECVGVFLGRLEARLDPEHFVDDFLGSLSFRPAAGAAESLVRLRSAGLAVAVVSNWDCSLPDTLAATGLLELVDAVVASADVGVPKPAPDPFHRALHLLGVSEPSRVLHVGDEADDEEGARAAGLHFAPAPFVTAVAGLV